MILNLNDMVVSRLSLGTAQFGLSYGINNRQGRMSINAAGSLLHMAEQSGISFLDTAIVYGEAEAVLGQLGVQNFRVTSKLPRLPETVLAGPWLEEQITQSLKRLSIHQAYACLLHHPADLLGPQGQELYRGLLKERDKGRIARIGLSIYGPEELDNLSADMQFDVVQFPYNIFDNRLARSGHIQKLHDSGIETQARSIFLQGLLFMQPAKRPQYFAPWQDLFNRFDDYLQASGQSALEAALSHVLADKHVDRLVLGVDGPDHLTEILNALPESPQSLKDKFTCHDNELINPGLWKLT